MSPFVLAVCACVYVCVCRISYKIVLSSIESHQLPHTQYANKISMIYSEGKYTKLHFCIATVV